MQKLGSTFAQVDADQALVAPDAVVQVHHRVAHLQLRQVLDQRIDAAGLLLLAALAGLRRGGEQFGLGDELHRNLLLGFVPVKTFGQRVGGNRNLLGAGNEIFQRVGTGHRDAVVAQQFQQALAAAVAFGHQQHAVRRVLDVRLKRAQRVSGAAVDGQVRQGPAPVRRLDAAQ